MDDPRRDLEEKEGLIRRCLSAEEQARKLELEVETLLRYQREVQQLNAENAILRGRVDKLITENNHKNKQIDELFRKWEGSNLHLTIRENSEFQSRLDLKEQKVDALEAQINALEAKLTEKIQAITNFKLESQEKDSEVKSNRRELDQLRADNQSLQAEVDRLLSDDFLKSQKALRDREAAYFKSCIQSLNEESAKNQENLRSQIAGLEELSRKKDAEVSDILRRLEAQKGASDAERAKLLNEVKNFEFKLQDKDSEVQRLTQQASSLRYEFEREQERLKQEAVQLSSLLHAKDAELQRVRQQASYDKAQAGAEINRLKEKSDELSALREKGESELKRMAGRLEELLEKAANEQSRLKSLEIVLQDRESQIRIQNEHVEKLASKIHELNRDIDDARLRQSNLQEESVKERREQARRIQDMEREIAALRAAEKAGESRSKSLEKEREEILFERQAEKKRNSEETESLKKEKLEILEKLEQESKKGAEAASLREKYRDNDLKVKSLEQERVDILSRLEAEERRGAELESLRREKAEILARIEASSRIAAPPPVEPEGQKSAAVEPPPRETAEPVPEPQPKGPIAGAAAILPEESEAPAAPAGRRPDAAAESPKKILLAESNMETHQVLQKALIEEGYIVLGAQNSAELFESVRRDIPDIIVMNITLSGLDGYSVVRELAKDPRTSSIPLVLIVSNPASQHIFTQDMQTAVKSFLSKPFSIQELVSSVQYVFLSRGLN